MVLGANVITYLAFVFVSLVCINSLGLSMSMARWWLCYHTFAAVTVTIGVLTAIAYSGQLEVLW
jgi:hypothetical protein